MEKILECFHQKTNLLFDWRKKDVDILDDMGVSNYQEKFFLKVNYSFNITYSNFNNKNTEVFPTLTAEKSIGGASNDFLFINGTSFLGIIYMCKQS